LRFIAKGEKMSYEHFVNNYQRYLKSPRTLSEAFKDAYYCSAITYPKEPDHGGLIGFLMALLFVGIFGYGFWVYLGV